ncbi:MAG: sigma factor-like helix-turn-helix DNA-binding protein [Desulfotomaculaceae bacterium]|nr:sigma factor-like helix-turn-helix DNA-binding protein [Desulfotomaculaceae bacterium]
MKIEIRGVERLSFRERQVVTLKEMGYSTNKIAKQLNLSASTITTLFSRARSKGYEVVIVVPGHNLSLFDVDDNSDEEGEEQA